MRIVPLVSTTRPQQETDGALIWGSLGEFNEAAIDRGVGRTKENPEG